MEQKPYLKAPDDELDPATAARIAWENHKKRNESIMVELFDVRKCLKIENLCRLDEALNLF